MTWEQLDEVTFRMKVPGGWVVKSSKLALIQEPITVGVLTGAKKSRGVSVTDALCFVPDPGWTWLDMELSELSKENNGSQER